TGRGCSRWTSRGAGSWRSATSLHPGPDPPGPRRDPRLLSLSSPELVAPIRGFPEGFLWGCATAAHQVEGNNHNCDWWEFEQRGGIWTGDSADPACDHYNRFRDDFRQLQELHN